MPRRTDILWTEELTNDLRNLWEQGLTCEVIGKRIGVSKNAIAGKARRLELPERDRRVSSETREKAIDLISKGWSRPQISRQLKISVESVTNIARDSGLRVANQGHIKPSARLPARYKETAPMPLPLPPVKRDWMPLFDAWKPLPVSLVPLRPVEIHPARSCQFITSDEKPWVFCTDKAVVGSYCQCHHDLTHVKTRAILLEAA